MRTVDALDAADDAADAGLLPRDRGFWLLVSGPILSGEKVNKSSLGFTLEPQKPVVSEYHSIKYERKNAVMTRNTMLQKYPPQGVVGNAFPSSTAGISLQLLFMGNV